MPAVAPFGARCWCARCWSGHGAELRGWCAREVLAWVEDPSNADERLDRNYLRAQVLPALRARWPGAAAHVWRAPPAMRPRRSACSQASAPPTPGARPVGFALSASVLRRLPAERRRNALRHWITAAGFLAPPTRRLQEISGALLAARPDTRPLVAWAGRALAARAAICSCCGPTRRPPQSGRAAPVQAPPARRPLPLARQGQRRWPLPGGLLSSKADARGPLDLGALAPRLTLRERRGGERLRPAGGGPRRALKGLLQQAHIPVEERAWLPLLFAGEPAAGGGGPVAGRVGAGGSGQPASRAPHLARRALREADSGPRVRGHCANLLARRRSRESSRQRPHATGSLELEL